MSAHKTLPKNPDKILFVCTGNSCRSVMAAGLFKKMLNGTKLNTKVDSAGVSAMATMGASDETIRLMKEAGVDVSSHRGQPITRELVYSSDVVIVMQTHHEERILETMPEAASKIHLLSDFYDGEHKELMTAGIPDPIGMGPHFYLKVLKVIEISLKNVLKEISKS
jgi:protein-tyrosine-phosphatase